MRALNVVLRASVPATAALNQNRPPSLDSAMMTVLAINIIGLMIVDLAAPFRHCSLGVLKWFRYFRTPTDLKNSLISWDLHSPALSRITNYHQLVSASKSAMSLYHRFTTLIVSFLVFIPYFHRYPVWLSTYTTACRYPSTDLTDDENESMLIWYSGGPLSFAMMENLRA
jgi:hypothetical protein